MSPEQLEPEPEPSEISNEVETKLKDSVSEKLMHFFRSRLGLKALALMGLFSMVSLGLEKPRKFSYGPSIDRVEMVLDQGSKCNFENWEDYSLDPDAPLVEPSGELKQIISTDSKLTYDAGILPMKFNDRAAFDQWVSTQINNRKLLEEVGAKDLAEATPKQLIELGSLVTGENLEWTNAEKDEAALYDSAKKPIDEIISKKLKTECLHYAVVNKAIYGSIKSSHPSLKNTYLNVITTSPGKIAHVYNSVTTLKSAHEADITFIDPTAMDHRFGEVYLADEGPEDLYNNWEKN